MLTTLGIVIGIMAVIAIMEIGKGASATLGKSIQSMGSNLIIVMPGAASNGGIEMGAGTLTTLTPGDVAAIIEECPSIAAAAPSIQARMQVVHGSRNWVPATMLGTTPAYLQIRDWKYMEEGDCFTEQDVRNSNKVCIIGQTLVKELFDSQSPIGRTVRINNVPIRVVGVLSRKGANVMGMDQDDVLLTPWTTLKNRVSSSTLGFRQPKRIHKQCRRNQLVRRRLPKIVHRTLHDPHGDPNDEHSSSAAFDQCGPDLCFRS
jgi:ABC-type antimicrobial peptide transport system permease subunit